MTPVQPHQQILKCKNLMQNTRVPTFIPVQSLCTAHRIVQGAVHLGSEDASDKVDGVPNHPVDLGDAAQCVWVLHTRAPYVTSW